MKNNVEIITIGDEILIGQIVDTNSAWMAVELNKAGFEVVQITSVHDDANHIISALDAAINRVDIVLFTGGIGPTKDDITKQTLCKYFNTKLRFEYNYPYDAWMKKMEDPSISTNRLLWSWFPFDFPEKIENYHLYNQPIQSKVFEIEID